MIAEQVRSPVLDALGGGAVQEEKDYPEYEWFRYSQLALPALLLILLLSATSLSLTLWQGNTTIKEFREGTPRFIELPTSNDANEAGIPKYNRNTRISALSIGAISVLLVFLVMYTKPVPKTRRLLYIVLALLCILAALLAFVSFGLNVGNYSDATRCRQREQGSTSLYNDFNCQQYDSMAVTALVLDMAIGVLALLTGLTLAYLSLQGAKQVTDEEFDALPQRHVTRSTKEILVIMLVATLVVCLLQVAFVVLLHEARDSYTMDEAYGSEYATNNKPGWPIKNTRLRIALGSIVILTVILTLVPFRSRVIAYTLAFALALTVPVALMAFALDVKAVDLARDLPCPTNFDCGFSQFYATVVFDLLLALVVLFYVLFEFVYRLAQQTTHVRREDALEFTVAAQ